MGSLSKSGLPGPSVEAASYLSTQKGGHIVRRIKLAHSLMLLDDVLWASRKKLELPHISAAARKLSELAKKEHANPTSFLVQKMGREIEHLAMERAERMTLWYIAETVCGLSSANYRMTDECLARLAIVLVANNCGRMQLSSGNDFRDIVYGFSSQHFNNAVFWNKVLAFGESKMASWHGNLLSASLRSISRLPLDTIEQSKSFVAAALTQLQQSVPTLNHTATVDALVAVAQLQQKLPAVATAAVVGPLISQLKSHGWSLMVEMKPHKLASFVCQLRELGQVDADLLAMSAKLLTPAAHQLPLFSVVNMLVTCNKLDFQDDLLLEALADQAQQLLPQVRQQPGVQVELRSVLRKLPAGPGVRALLKELPGN